MKNIDEIADTIDVLKKRNKEPIGICNSYIAIGVSKWWLSRKHIEDFNQIGALVFCNEESDKLYECLNLIDSLIEFLK